MASIDAFKVRAVIEAGYDKNSLRRANNEIAASFNNMRSRMAKVQAVAAQAQTSFMMVGAAVAASFGAGVVAAASFEEQFVRVKKTLDIAGDSRQAEKALESISKKLRDLTKLAPVTTDTVTEIAAIGGQLGVAAKDIVTFTDTIQKLTIATNLSAENAAMAMSRLQEITKTSTDELDNLGSSLVALGNNFAAQESEIVNAALQIATSTAQIQGEMNNAAVDALAFSTALKAIGQPSQAGATAIVRLMTEVSEAIALGGDNLELFAQVARMSVPAFEELFKIDSSQAVAAFIQGLDDTSSLGQTNISVLQRLGLGQVRTQKAILALAKANDTLFDALATANEAYTENNALTEEAERRYETLFSEIQRGKNLLKAEFIDFGLENLDGAKDIVRTINDFLLAITKSVTTFTKKFSGLLGVGVTVVSIFRGITKSLTTSAIEGGILAASLDRAKASAVGLKATLGSSTGQILAQEGFDLGFAAGPTSGLMGNIGLPFNTLQRQGISEFLVPGKFNRRIQQTLANPALMNLIFGGNIPMDIIESGGMGGVYSKQMNAIQQAIDKNPGLREFPGLIQQMRDDALQEVTAASMGEDPMMRFAAESRIGGTRFYKPTFLSNKALNTQVRYTKGLISMQKALMKVGVAEEFFGTRVKANTQILESRQKIQRSMEQFMSGIRNKGGLGFRQVLDKNIEELLGDQIDFGALSRRQRASLRRQALEGSSAAFNKRIEAINETIEATQTATAEELQFLEAVDKGRAGLGRFTNAIKGVSKAIAKLVFFFVAIQGLIKLIGKFGEESRGIDEFAASISNAAEQLAELNKERMKLEQFTAEGGLLSGIQDAATLEQTEKEIERRRLAAEKAQRELASELGRDFINNIIIAQTGLERNNQGGILESLIRKEAAALGKGRSVVEKEVGDAVGNVLLNAIDPENLKVSGGALPTVAEILDSLFFQEQAFETVSGLKINIPSTIFDGVSSGMLIALQESQGRQLSSADLLSFMGLDDLNDPNALGEIMMDYYDYIQKFGMDNAVESMIDGGRFLVPINKQLDDMFDSFRNVFGEEYSDTDVAKFVLDFTQSVAVAEGMIGTSIGNIEESFLKRLTPNSVVGQQIQKFIKERLEVFRDSGILAPEEIARAGGSYEKIVALYLKAYDQMVKDAEMTTEEMKEEFNITESAALQLAARLDQAFKEARKSLVALTAPLPDDAFEDMTALDVLINTVRKNAQQAKFEKVLESLGAFGKPVLAAELSKVGVGGLAMAETFLQNPALASAQELYLRSLGGTDFVSEIVQDESEDVERERMNEMGYTLGESAVDGLLLGIEDRSDEIADMFAGVLDDAFNNVFSLYGISSPSQWTRQHIGRPLIDGIIIGIRDGEGNLKDIFTQTINKALPRELDLPDTTGNFRGFQLSYEELVGKLSSNSSFMTNDFLAQGFLRSLGATMMENLDMFAEKLANSYGEANSRMQEAFNLITAVTSAERAQTDQVRNLVSAKQNYAATLRREATLEERIIKSKEKLKDLEVEGMKGNITMQERIGVLQKEIDLTERKRRLDKEFTAREALDIQEQEKKVAELGRMFNLGIVSALELEAEQDALRDMKGEFKTDAEKELFLLEYASAIEQKEEYEKEILEISPELVQAREEYIGLLNEQELISLDVQAGANGIAEAEERVAAGVLAVDAAYVQFKENAPEYEAEIGALEGAFGNVNERVGELFDLITNLSAEGTFDFSSLKTQISEVTQDLADLLFAREMDELLNQGGKSGFRNFYQMAIENMTKETGFEGRSFSQLMRSNLLGFDAFPILMDLYESLGGRDGSEVQDLSNINRFGQFFRDSEFTTNRFARTGNMLNNTRYGQSMIEFLNMMGIGTVETAEGELGFSISNAEEISKGLSKELMVLGLRGMQEYEFMKLLDAFRLGQVRDGVITDLDEDDLADPSGSGTLPPRSSNITINLGSGTTGNMDANMMGYLQGILDSYNYPHTSFGVPGGMMGMRAKGFKMGGRVPDMTHVKPKKYAMGGRDNLMRRALVGEYGPEEVRFVPGSGFLVKPLTHGGRGNNTIVENLSVNVTGVPADPSHARKAAQEIRKALNRLDREGASGGSVRRA